MNKATRAFSCYQPNVSLILTGVYPWFPCVHPHSFFLRKCIVLVFVCASEQLAERSEELESGC